MATSLIDDAGFDSIGQRKAGPAAAGKRGDRLKLVLALGAIVGVGGLLLWYYDLLGLKESSERRAVAAQAEKHKRAFEQQEKERAEEELKPDTVKGKS